jgi:hypothetical protein
MHWSDIPRNPPSRTLRWFAVFWILACAGLAGWQFLLFDRALFACLLLGLGLTVGLLGIAAPARVRPVFVGAMIVTFPLNWLASRLLLALVFYCLITPLGLFFKLIGRDLLARRICPDQDSYWVSKPEADDIRSYFRQG